MLFRSPKTYYTIAELAQIFMVSEDTIERRIKSKVFPPPIPRATKTERRLWPVQVIDEFKRKRDKHSEDYKFCAYV